MDQVENVETITNLPLDVSMSTFDDMLKILNALGNGDALAIFFFIKDGMTSSKEVIRSLGLSQKRFYSRLKTLIDMGLIEKVDGIYIYTSMGRIMYKMSLSFIEILENKEKIKFISDLSRNKALNDEERAKITGFVADNLELGPMLSPLIDGVELGTVKKITKYEELVSKLVEDIGKAKTSALLASNYVEAAIVEEQIKASRRGVDFKVILSSETMSKRITKLKLLLSPKIFLNLAEFVQQQKNSDAWFREFDLPFSFCIIDEQKCYFELPPFQGEFTIAFYLNDKKISERFADFFEKIWAQSAETSKEAIAKLF